MIITLKDANRDFLQSPHCATNRLLHVRSSDPGATADKSRASSAFHMQHIVCHVVLLPSHVHKTSLEAGGGERELVSY